MSGSSPTPSAVQNRLRPVPLPCLRPDSDPLFDVYIIPRGGSIPVLYKEKHLRLTQEILSRMEQNQIETVYVDSNQWPEFRRYLEENLPHILADDRIDRGKKAELVYDTTQGLMEEVMSEPRAGELITRSRDLVGHMVPFLRNEEGALEELIRVASFDYYTYTHSVNVFVFSNALARQMGITDDATLRDFGVGALLHDIGKSRLDPAVINSRGKLTDEQWEQMKMHPVWGHELAEEHGGFSPLALDVIRHHHEKLTGTGYPDKLKSNSITLYTRILTICDVFDALTTRRSYKDALNSFPALKLMKDEMPRELDQECFYAFVNMMANPD